MNFLVTAVVPRCSVQVQVQVQVQVTTSTIIVIIWQHVCCKIQTCFFQGTTFMHQSIIVQHVTRRMPLFVQLCLNRCSRKGSSQEHLIGIKTNILEENKHQQRQHQRHSDGNKRRCRRQVPSFLLHLLR